MIRFLIIALASLLATACAPATYSARTLDASAPAAHRTVAILPFEVTQDRVRMRDIQYPGSDTSQATLQQIQQQWHATQLAESKALAYQLQALLQEQLRAQQPKAGYSVQFQEVQETNRRLQQAGITYASLPERSMQELQQALGVDALLSGQTDLFQPLPGALSLVGRVLLNESLEASDPEAVIPPNQATTNLTIHDCRSGQLIWRFDYSRTGTAALKPTNLVTDVVRTAAPEFPYRQK